MDRPRAEDGMTVRRICVVTGSRAEYGILQWLMRDIRDDPRCELQILVTGAHLSPDFGLTYQAIEADGFHIDRRIEVLLSSDTAVGVSKAVGLGVIGFADAFADLCPAVVVVLGDRFECLAATQAAFFAGIPVAHISGGELTEGALDDSIRHCITKLSRYHFVAAEPYRRRVIQLGEPPDAVFNVGDPGLDNLVRLPLLARDELAACLEFDPGARYFLVTYHPVTAGGGDPRLGMQALLDALDRFPDRVSLITKPNADAGGRELTAMIEHYAAKHSGRVRVFHSLGQQRYLSAMKYCDAVVGNSSSGIVEAPVMGVPTVNIGTRQLGRLKAASILDVEETADCISAGLAAAVSDAFIAAAKRAESPYGSSNASRRIQEFLATVELGRRAAKKFHDLHA